MSDQETQWLVITDLDGTLLNHDTYAFDKAQATIRLLQARKIPVILNTSKTYAETITIRKTLALHDPFIVENGSCLFIPRHLFSEQPAEAKPYDNYWAIPMGKTREEISRIIESIDIAETLYTRLSQCSVEQAVTLTGLTPEQAKQAIARDFSEPLIWHADKITLDNFRQRLKSHNLTTLQGGRFLHVLGDCDKGRATRFLAKCYNDDIKIIALGDSANDAAMLAEADISIIVNSPSNHQLTQLITPTLQTRASAPQGWAEAINKALQLID